METNVINCLYLWMFSPIENSLLGGIGGGVIGTLIDDGSGFFASVFAIVSVPVKDGGGAGASRRGCGGIFSDMGSRPKLTEDDM